MTLTDQALAKLQPPPGAPAAAWVVRINACWQASVKAILEVGRLLSEAKAALPHGTFGKMIDSELPFTARTAQMLVAIAADPRLSNPKHVSHLPASWGTMYELTKLDDATFEARVADGTIRPDLERSEAVAVRKEAIRAPAAADFASRVAEGCDVSDLDELAETGWAAGAIMADPPWLFMTRSAKGQDRSPRYRTDPLSGIKSLPIPRLAAPNSMALIWCVDWAIPGALEVMAAWGFEFKTVAFTWAKKLAKGDGWHMGQGYWTRANPEMCLLGTKGRPTRLNADVRQLIVSRIAEHSRKPDEIHDHVERLVGGPYLEVYARRPHKGWKTWGNEISKAAFAAMDATPVDGVGNPLAYDVNGVVAEPEITQSEAATLPAASPEPATQPPLVAGSTLSIDDEAEIQNLPAFLRRASVSSVSSPRSADTLDAGASG